MFGLCCSCINFYVAQTRDKLGPNYYKKDLAEKIKYSKSNVNPAVKQVRFLFWFQYVVQEGAWYWAQKSYGYFNCSVRLD